MMDIRGIYETYSRSFSFLMPRHYARLELEYMKSLQASKTFNFVEQWLFDLMMKEAHLWRWLTLWRFGLQMGLCGVLLLGWQFVSIFLFPVYRVELMSLGTLHCSLFFVSWCSLFVVLLLVFHHLYHKASRLLAEIREYKIMAVCREVGGWVTFWVLAYGCYYLVFFGAILGLGWVSDTSFCGWLVWACDPVVGLESFNSPLSSVFVEAPSLDSLFAFGNEGPALSESEGPVLSGNEGLNPQEGEANNMWLYFLIQLALTSLLKVPPSGGPILP